MKKSDILARLEKIPGKKSFYYKNLITGETIAIQEELPMMAASVIKLPILVEAYRQMEAGRIRCDQLYVLQDADKRPSCGALNRLHQGLALTVEDLCNLMIILSDNSATNILIGLLGQEQINASMRERAIRALP